MNKKAGLWVALMMLMWVPTLLFAQSPPPFDAESPFGVTDVQVPFDEGVDLLIAAGIAYGLLRIRAHKRNQKLKKQALL